MIRALDLAMRKEVPYENLGVKKFGGPYDDDGIYDRLEKYPGAD